MCLCKAGRVYGGRGELEETEWGGEDISRNRQVDIGDTMDGKIREARGCREVSSPTAPGMFVCLFVVLESVRRQELRLLEPG